jgi:tetratricopeptide (TPR) repeat protein
MCNLKPVWLLLALWLGVSGVAGAADSRETNPEDPILTLTNAQELMQSYLRVQEQLHATQLAIERTRKEADASALRSTEQLQARLKQIESAIDNQRTSELAAMQSANRVMLLVAGSFAGAGLVAMLLTAYFQWRTVTRMAELSASVPMALRALPAPSPVTTLAPAEAPAPMPNLAAEHSNARLLESLSRLEKRILELEFTARPSLNGGETNGNGHHPEGAEPLTELVSSGQALLEADQAQEALAKFDAALELNPKHPDTLVKRGSALEKLRRLEEAIECYNKAIEVDDTLTIAYLQKGGLFNRMERFDEALQCYELALRVQEKRRATA